MDDTQGQQPLTSDDTPIGTPAIADTPPSPDAPPVPPPNPPDMAATGPEPSARHEDEAFERCVHTIENLLGPDTVRRNVVDRLRMRFYGLE